MKRVPIVFIKNFNRLITNKTKYHGKNDFADVAYNTSVVPKYYKTT